MGVINVEQNVLQQLIKEASEAEYRCAQCMAIFCSCYEDVIEPDGI